MRFSKIALMVVITLIVGLIFGPTVMADDEFIDPEIPESWYEDPKLASEMNITEFRQSPVLDEKVEEGELPGVEERLPNDPPVVEPYAEIGEYGGTARIWAKSDFRGNTMYFKWPEHAGGAGRPAPDGSKIVADRIAGWEYSNNFTELTLYLREGMKWSDGHPLTADDYLFWWEHEAKNAELNPTPPEEWKPVGLLELEKVDDYTVKLTFDEPHPRYHQYNFQYNMGVNISPAHYMKQFNPDFIEEEELEEMTEEAGMDEWYEFYGRIRDDSPDHPEYDYQRPVLRPYVVTKRSENHMIWERNPYWPFVDTEGNQLPYIDQIRVDVVTEPEMATTKAVTGEATLAGRFALASDIPLYSRNEAEENYETRIWTRAYGSEVNLLINLSHKDEEMREIFQDLRFRRAVSHAIDRERINDKAYFNLAKPMQTTVPTMNQFYKEEYAQSYAEFDPDKTEELLDEIGLVDKNGDGNREFPDGDTFNPQLIFTTSGPINPTQILELVQKDLSDVGINIDLQMQNRNLRDTRWSSNEGDLSTWSLDQALDLTFGNEGSGVSKGFAPIGHAKDSTWPGWVNWYSTNGEEGVEPPAEIKELIEYAEILGYSPDEEKRQEAGKALVKAQADNIWSVGVAGMTPQPLIVSNNLKNMPEKGIWDWSTGYMYPYRAMQFYLEE